MDEALLSIGVAWVHGDAPAVTTATTAAAPATATAATARAPPPLGRAHRHSARPRRTALGRRAADCAGHRTAARRATRAVHLGLPPGAVAAEGVTAPRRATGARRRSVARDALPAPAPASMRDRQLRRPLRCRRMRDAAPAAATARALPAGAGIAGARGRGRLADGAADLAGLLVGLPRGAATAGCCRAPLPRLMLPVLMLVLRLTLMLVSPQHAVVVAAPGRADRRAPDDARRERGTGRIRVVVRRVGRRVVAVDRRRAVDDDGRRVVLRHVDHLRIGRDDGDDLLLDLHDLLAVGLEVAGRLRLAAKALDRLQHRALVGDDRLAQRARPVEIGAHHLHDVGIVEQRLDRVVPLVVDGKLRIGLALVEKAVRLHQLQRIGRGGQDDRDQVVRIERDRADELAQVLRRTGGGAAPPAPPAPARRHSPRRRAGRFPPAVRASARRGDDPRPSGTKPVHHACSKSCLRPGNRAANRAGADALRAALLRAWPPRFGAGSTDSASASV